MKRTYIDASVLIAAFRGDPTTSRCAMEVLDDPDRELVISDFLKLEVLPKPKFHGLTREVEFMMAVLNKAAEDVPCDSELTKTAINVASDYDLAPIDALHVAAAMIAKVDEFVTLEKPTKPICKVSTIKVRSLHPNGERS